MTQEEIQQLVRDLVATNDCTVFEVTIIPWGGIPKAKAIVLQWANTRRLILRVQISDNEDIPNEVKFFYNDGIRTPYYRSILFNNGTNVIPSELKDFLRVGNIVSVYENQSRIQEEIRRIFLFGSEWNIMD